MKQIRIIHSVQGNWYRVGDVYDIRDEEKYSSIGIQVYNGITDHSHPDIVMHGDYEYVQ